MRVPGVIRRTGPLLVLIGAALFVVTVFYLAAWVLRPELGPEPTEWSVDDVAAVERLRDVSFDHDNMPVATVDVDYEADQDASWRPKGESPMLAELEAEGRLPPVGERVGREPLVMRGVEGVGTYGGTWFRAASSMVDVDIIRWRMSGATLVRWSPLGYPIRPHVAKAYEVSDDYREFTFHLRKGMRWSDGHPFTVDDIIFTIERDQFQLGSRPDFLRAGGSYGRPEKIDDHTIRFSFDRPNALFLERLCATSDWVRPKHYLEPFHPIDGDPELIQRMMTVLQLASPRSLYTRMKHALNVEHPQIWPWIYRTHTANPPYGFVRNPYFWAVDEAGNQLPYIDRILFEVKPNDLIGLDASQGRLTFQMRHIHYRDYTLLMSEREANNYEVYHWFSATASPYAVFPNMNRRVDPDRPETRLKHDLLNEKAFRQALSVAINRQAIIDLEYNGQGEPAQLDPGPESPFHHPPLFKSFTEFDPGRANELLDGLGLVKYDGEGYRRFADGTRMVFFIYVTDYTGNGPAQLMISDWARVGLRVVLKDRARTLFEAELFSMEQDLTVWSGESEYHPLMEPRSFVAVSRNSFFAPGYGDWYAVGGLWGDPEVAARPGALEPPSDHPLFRSMQILDQALMTTGQDAQVEVFREALEIAAENVWTINVSTPPPKVAIVSRDLRNVPKNGIYAARYWTPANAGIETWYLGNPGDTQETVKVMRESIVEPTLDPRLEEVHRAAADAGGGSLVGLVRFLIYGILLAALLMVVLRHPFVGRRLVIMIPTLAIISVAVFIIIQLPESDFLTARIQQLEMMGDENSVQEVKDLREMFYDSESQLSRYLRWIGLRWFSTFEPIDRGLLQGYLGRSMENGRMVNDIVGDRILLTLFISVFTISFTWLFALPTGIYSAVRQYSIGDYTLTFLGFIGMCIPNFLLALILIHLSSEWFGIKVSGLFSSGFAGQAGWSWAKFNDLLKHIWVPIVVLGVGGTAGMIRVMRGNLLDELRRPYVVTARAKGVRPLKLLLKYPVRLALNPFISGIGVIFPQLVSSGAIVAMVLSLPTVGPLMLSALMAQDMYLAGSMLMVLSTLGVLGTLVSDLLLLMLDPRIRLEGGTR